MGQTFTRGDRVTTPGGEGRVLFVRFGPPHYAEIASVSVLLDVKQFQANYHGTIYPADQVTAEPIRPGITDLRTHAPGCNLGYGHPEPCTARREFTARFDLIAKAGEFATEREALIDGITTFSIEDIEDAIEAIPIVVEW